MNTTGYTKAEQADTVSDTLYLTAVGVVVVGIVAGIGLVLLGLGAASVIVTFVAVGVAALFLAAGFVASRVADRLHYYGR
ncbi:hypothetical protein GCM10010988_40450 [Cnuibacter physcomitrellae]|uniref:Uncharacterized protein n=1 Tax=Cnuibacter physcomitrellae TaxID=1619308 RepID=A0A1X9LR92_9MICO|nr:hypothetical protein [Cnuibacter physcomitrellae]ARJ07637.1 hypothetical protein B5808_19865 [Cnuibacter physcomitrellae]GGI42720.1 hypothetical protein GCM10010988_40450 [Cnuibacter physcomitrellae]